jgi:hypothetical protein
MPWITWIALLAGRYLQYIDNYARRPALTDVGSVKFRMRQGLKQAS